MYKNRIKAKNITLNCTKQQFLIDDYLNAFRLVSDWIVNALQTQYMRCQQTLEGICVTLEFRNSKHLPSACKWETKAPDYRKHANVNYIDDQWDVVHPLSCRKPCVIFLLMPILPKLCIKKNSCLIIYIRNNNL